MKTGMTTSALINECKRRRVGDHCFRDVNVQLSDLPDSILVSIADFLSKTSVALFAVAFSISKSDGSGFTSSSRCCIPSTTSKAIIASCAMSNIVCLCCANERVDSTPWEIIDFLDIEMSLRKRLTDDTLSSMLTCIDAIRTVKRLKLTNCNQITGRGLNPLRGSIVLEQCDLSLVGQHELPYSVECRLCVETVIPILTSIVNTSGAALRQLQFPVEWLNGTTSETFQAFLCRFNSFLRNESRRTICLVCEKRCPGMISSCITPDSNDFGMMMKTCYICLGGICEECDESSEEFSIDACIQCKKVYCQDCNPVIYCELCDNTSCDACGLVSRYCEECDIRYCEFCEHGND